MRTGLAAHEIVEAARDLDSDLIVIATHGYTGWKHLCIGSTPNVLCGPRPALFSWCARNNTSYSSDDDGHCAGTRTTRAASGIASLPRRAAPSAAMRR